MASMIWLPMVPLDLSHTETALGWKPTFDMEAGLSHYAYELRRLSQ